MGARRPYRALRGFDRCAAPTSRPARACGASRRSPVIFPSAPKSCRLSTARRLPGPRRSKTRPLLLLPRAEPAEVTALVPDGPPRRFCWRGVTYDVAGAQGPERIGAEWWREPHLSAIPRKRGTGQGTAARSRAIITSSRISAATASGSTAKAFTGAKRRRRAGSCKVCLREGAVCVSKSDERLCRTRRHH